MPYVPFYGRYFTRQVNTLTPSPKLLYNTRHPLLIAAMNQLESTQPTKAAATCSPLAALSSNRATSDSQHIEIDYSYANGNEIQAIAIAKNILNDVRVPEIFFAGKVLMLSLPNFFIMILSLIYILDQQSSGASLRKTHRYQFNYRVAVSILRLKGSI